MRFSRSTLLIGAGVLLLSMTLVVSALATPSRDISRTEPYPEANTNATSATVETRGVLVSLQGGGQNWQQNGRIYLLQNNTKQWMVADRNSYFGATMLARETVVAGFHENGYESGCAPYETPCPKTGFRVFDPDGRNGSNTLTEYTFPLPTPYARELHDVEPLGTDSFVFADMHRERIAIVTNGSLVWEWRATESALYDSPAYPASRDWLHINDVDYLGDRRFLVSVRNANQLVIVEHGEGVVEVINEDRSATTDDSCRGDSQLADFDADGEIHCGDPDVLNHQHNPQWLGPGRVLVADSENDRIVELIRTANGTWEPAWTLEQAGGFDLDWPRDADRLPNGNTLVTDSYNKRVFEVTPEGRVVWSYGTTLIPYEADRLPVGEQAGTYRPGEGTGSIANGTQNTTALNQYEGTTNPSGSDWQIPVLSRAMVGIRTLFPRIPVWFGGLQLLVTLISIGLVSAGGIDWYRDR